MLKCTLNDTDKVDEIPGVTLTVIAHINYIVDEMTLNGMKCTTQGCISKN